MTEKSLQEKEIELLTKEEEIFDLESLITDGIEAKVPIEIKYGEKTFGALIKPLTSTEWNNATRINLKNPKTTADIELVKKGLYNLNGEKYPPETIEKLPAGIILEIMKQIAKISGIELNTKENKEIAKELMGF